MLTKLFGGGTKKVVHCEMTGKETSIDKTRVLTRINGVINIKLFENPEVDLVNKIIYSTNKPPISFFVKIHTPTDLKEVLGEFYAIVENTNELEQSTHILSDEGVKVFMGRQLMKLIDYIDKSEIITFPKTMFFTSINDLSEFYLQNKTCKNWKLPYSGFEKKYMEKKIKQSKIQNQISKIDSFQPGFDIIISDHSAKNPNGTVYSFKTEGEFRFSDFCSNESAVNYCTKNNVLIFYKDFMNGGKIRVLSKHTESINTKLQNDYKFRSC